MYLMAPLRKQELLEDALEKRHAEYFAKANSFKYLYYAFRIIAGVSAALLPFTISWSQLVATVLSAAIAVITVLDTLFVPRERWKLYSRTTDKLWVAQIKERGEYEKYKDRIEEILKAEAGEMELLTDLQAMLDNIEKQQQQPKRKAPAKR